MKHIKRFLNQRKILVLLLVLLAMSTGLNVYLFFGVIKPSQEGRGGEETYAWIQGFGHFMWAEFSIKLIPNRAVFDSSDRQFNVTVKGKYWAPYASEGHTFYFKIYAKRIYAGALPVDEPPELVGEKNYTCIKSKDEYHYKILFNFTVILDMIKPGIHLFRVVGESPKVSFTNWGCIAVFAVSFK